MEENLDLEEYRRYGRQMLIPEIGKPGQLLLKQSSVLVIGVGGLGCPCIAYLAGAGIGTLGLVDADTIELSNSHRQILHTSAHIDHYKVDSARTYVKDLNNHVNVRTYPFNLTASNAVDIVKDYDIVLDCTDNQSTRYLISDACVSLSKPLVSGSALKTEGQLAVYNFQGGPCYRCLFPCPTVAELVQTCGEAGILGPVVGIIGVMQALETIKIICWSTRQTQSPYVPTLTLFSAWDMPQWRTVKLRRKKPQCVACGIEHSTDLVKRLAQEPTCAINTVVIDNAADSRVERIEPSKVLQASHEYTIIDVRSHTEYGIVNIPNSINVPMDTIDDYSPESDHQSLLIVCRTGKDSLNAAQMLSHKFPKLVVRDLRGGLQGLATVDSNFPIY